MYLSILSFDTINKLKLFFEYGIPMPQDAGTPSLLLVHILNLYIISFAVLENGPPTQGYRKKATFFTLIVVPLQDAQPSITTFNHHKD
jgi:hypothetical protein